MLIGELETKPKALFITASATSLNKPAINGPICANPKAPKNGNEAAEFVTVGPFLKLYTHHNIDTNNKTPARI